MLLGIQIPFLNELMENYFTNDSNLYVGLGIAQNNAQSDLPDFTEPSDLHENTGYSRARVIFGRAVNGIVRNENEIAFPTAEADWTVGDETISALGVFRLTLKESEDGLQPSEKIWDLLCVLPLVPAEKVVKGETLVLNPNAIRLQITNG